MGSCRDRASGRIVRGTDRGRRRNDFGRGLAGCVAGASWGYAGRRRDDILRAEKLADDVAHQRSATGRSWGWRDYGWRGRGTATLQSPEVVCGIGGGWRRDDRGRG